MQAMTRTGFGMGASSGVEVGVNDFDGGNDG